MTASITEALRIARGYVADDVKRKPSGYDPSSDLRVINEALASLSCGEARERIARMVRRAMIDNPTGGTSEERAAKRASIADEYATAYLADLAPDEAAIRADQKERDAKVALIQAKQGATAEQIAAAIRDGRGEG